MEPLFAQAEAVVSKYFRERKADSSQGTIEIFGERYLLVRGAALSVEFFSLVKELFGKGRESEAEDFARNMLFDLAHAIGKSDARNFHVKMGLSDPIERLSAGPVHFSHTGWAFVKVLPQSRPSPDNDYYLIYDHPQSFEADTWIQSGLEPIFPVCIMNSGYSSGWCQESFGVPLVSTEILCRAKGDPYCRFIMAPPDRVEAHVECYMKETPDFAQRMKSHTIPDFFSRKRLEEDLRRSEAQYRGICEASADAILIIDAEGIIADVNPAASSLYGYPRQEIVGLSVAKLVHPDYHHLLEDFKQVYSTQDRFHAESVDVRKDGTHVNVEVHGAGFEYEGAPHLLAIVRDITQRKEAEVKLAALNSELISTSRQAGMAEVATNVLHNVGNVLNSVNVSAGLMADRLRHSETANLTRAVNLMRAHEEDLAHFLTQDERGRQLPEYLELLAQCSVEERAAQMEELRCLRTNIEHINNVISMQQSYAKVSPVSETVRLEDLIEDAIRVEANALERRHIAIIRDFAELPGLVLRKHEILQILINLLSNARHALENANREDKRITLRTRRASDGNLCVEVADNGVGILHEDLTRVFAFGFTRREDGHGFGLHSSALAAKELGGSLQVSSDGPGQGATFVLQLPFQPAADPPPPRPRDFDLAFGR